jgi:hypothetical protein
VWYCSKCGRAVSDDVEAGLDPRFALGRCNHGRDPKEHDPERVAVLADRKRAESVIDERKAARDYRRAKAKQLAGQDLSARESEALRRHEVPA